MSVVIKRNVDFQVEIPQAATSWISLVQNATTRGLEPKTLTFAVAKNYSGAAREAIINVVNEKEDLSVSFLIHPLNELEDRFGPIPDEVNSLMSIAKIKILCRKLKIDSLKERRGVVTILFNKKANISIDKLMDLLKTNANKIKMNPKNTYEMQMFIENIDLNTKTDFIREKLEMLL